MDTTVEIPVNVVGEEKCCSHHRNLYQTPPCPAWTTLWSSHKLLWVYTAEEGSGASYTLRNYESKFSGLIVTIQVWWKRMHCTRQQQLHLGLKPNYRYLFLLRANQASSCLHLQLCSTREGGGCLNFPFPLLCSYKYIMFSSVSHSLNLSQAVPLSFHSVPCKVQTHNWAGQP